MEKKTGVIAYRHDLLTLKPGVHNATNVSQQFLLVADLLSLQTIELVLEA